MNGNLSVSLFLLLCLAYLAIWLSILFFFYLYSFALISLYHFSNMPNERRDTCVYSGHK